MGLKTWWLESRLNRMESKLRTKRGLMRRVRTHADELAAQKKKGAISPEDFKARDAKLHEERERLTREINALIVEEEHVKKELAAAGGVNQTELRARP